METSANRRDDRYRFQIPVTLVHGRKSVSLTTEDVSFSGMFLHTDNPPSVRGLVRLSVPIPGRNDPLQLTGMVVHVIKLEHADGRVPGVGIQLYGIGSKAKSEWTDYVNSMRASHPGTVAVAPRAQILSRPKSQVQRERKFERYAGVLQVRVRTLDELETMYSRDISRGGMFLQATLDVQLGDLLFLELIHPETDEIFGLQCVVRRCAFNGMGVEFELDDLARDELWLFVQPVIDPDEVDLVELADPRPVIRTTARARSDLDAVECSIAELDDDVAEITSARPDYDVAVVKASG